MSNKENSYILHDTPKKNHLIGAILAGKLVAKAAVMFGFKLSTAYNIK
jgi:hypothetical protein